MSSRFPLVLLAAIAALAAGAATADWPAILPIADGDAYTITDADGSTAAVVWRMLAAAPTGLTGLADALLDKGCHAQLDRLRAAVLNL